MPQVTQIQTPRQNAPVQQKPQPAPRPSPETESMVRYFDVLAAAYRPRAVTLALEHVTGRRALPTHDPHDMDVNQAKWMIERYATPEGRAAGTVWLDRRAGKLPPAKNVPVSPQNAAYLVENFDHWKKVYGQNAVTIAAKAWLAGKTPKGDDVDSAQARWMVKYFDYLNNRPVVRQAVQTWLKQNAGAL